MKPTIHIIYHANCLDGFTAAWVTRKALLSQEMIEVGEENYIQYYACNYGDKLPEEVQAYNSVGLTVFIVDFSFNHEQMASLCATHNLVVLDHHKTAIEKLEGLNLPGILDTSRSGAMLAWNYFFPGTEVPALVKYIQDRDLWKWELEGSKEISECIQSYKKTRENWDKLSDYLNEIETRSIALDIGKSLLAKKDLDMEDLIANGLHTLYLDGDKDYFIPVINAPKIWSSEIGNKLCKLNPNMCCCATYCYIGGRIEVSLRSIGDFDVSMLAKQFGGGGHKNAAGFTLTPQGLAAMLKHNN